MPVSKPRKRKRGAKPRRPAATRSGSARPTPLFDPGPQTELDEAQELVYDAWEATGETRLALARAALDVSEDCADAWSILADDAGSLHEKRLLFEQAMIAGERALGAAAFEEDIGHFWGMIETRPYMRARLGLALTLYESGERSAALDHLQDLLRLNPMDNQGIRYLLLSFLLEDGRDEEVNALLAFKDYADDVGAHWTYGKALAIFRREGRSAAAEEALAEARRFNPHVPAFLAGRRRPPPMRSDGLIERGGESEAVTFLLDQGSAWRQTPGALDWVKGND